MFLHSGASLHGHEYSKRPAGSGAPQVMQPRRSPLLRSAFAPPKPRAANTMASRPTPTPRQHGRSVSEQLPRTPEPVVRFKEPESEPETVSLSAVDEHVSESEMSDATSSQSISSHQKKRRRRVPKKTTNYMLGYPAPKKLVHSKVMQKVLPRLLLQLQLCEKGWLKPVMEVFPAARIAGPVIAPRLAKKFPGILSARRQLARDDLVLIQRDDANVGPSTFESDEEKDTLGDDRLLAVYSPLKHSENTEIVLEDGSVWVATPLPSGSFDFVHIDSQGRTTTARWAKRQQLCQTATASTPTSDCSSPSDLQPKSRFTFSIINPLSRRHPVMATLTDTTLEVQDTYTSISSSYGRYPPTRSMSRTMSLTSAQGTEEPEGEIVSPGLEAERTTHVIDDTTKTLISVTALWVVLQSGWSPCYHPVSPEAGSNVSRRSSLRNTWAGRPEDLVLPPATPEAADTPPALLKRFSAPIQHCRGRSVSPDPTSWPPNVPPATTVQRLLPRRATSTGAAFMQRRIQQAGSLWPIQSQTPTQTPAVHSDKELAVSSGDDAPGSSARSTEQPSTPNDPNQSLYYTKSPDVLASASLSKAVTDFHTSDEDEAGTAMAKMDERHKGLRGRLFKWIHKLR